MSGRLTALVVHSADDHPVARRLGERLSRVGVTAWVAEGEVPAPADGLLRVARFVDVAICLVSGGAADRDVIEYGIMPLMERGSPPCVIARHGTGSSLDHNIAPRPPAVEIDSSPGALRRLYDAIGLAVGRGSVGPPLLRRS